MHLHPCRIFPRRQRSGEQRCTMYIIYYVYKVRVCHVYNNTRIIMYVYDWIILFFFSTTDRPKRHYRRVFNDVDGLSGNYDHNDLEKVVY